MTSKKITMEVLDKMTKNDLIKLIKKHKSYKKDLKENIGTYSFKKITKIDLYTFAANHYIKEDKKDNKTDDTNNVDYSKMVKRDIISLIKTINGWEDILEDEFKTVKFKKIKKDELIYILSEYMNGNDKDGGVVNEIELTINFLNETKTINGSDYNSIMEIVKSKFGVERFLLGTISANDGTRSIEEYTTFAEFEDNKDKNFYILIKATGAC